MKSVVIIGGLLLVAVFLVILGPFLYNDYLFPLGRLHKRIGVGDSCDDVRSEFAVYVERYGDADGFGFSQGVRDRDFSGNPIDPADYMAIYHPGPFDDIQLWVICDDANAHVTDIKFVGD